MALRTKMVNSFEQLLATPFAEGVNAVGWRRALGGDFAEVVRLLGPGEGIVPLEETRLRALPVSAAGRAAIGVMLADFQQLEGRGLAPELNIIYGYPREEEPGAVRTDVYSWHADRAPVAAETWLCSYDGSASEGLANDEAIRRVDDPETRAALRAEFGGEDGAEFREYLSECSYDLHYAARPGAQPYSFGLGNLWRIAVDYPGSPVPPCVHRAPEPGPGDPARLLLIC